jgi:hypothetical protein
MSHGAQTGVRTGVGVHASDGHKEKVLVARVEEGAALQIGDGR